MGDGWTEQGGEGENESGAELGVGECQGLEGDWQWQLPNHLPGLNPSTWPVTPVKSLVQI